MRASAKQRWQFTMKIIEHAGGDSARRESFANRLMRYGATYSRLQEQACNGYQDWRGNWDERATKEAEAKEARIEKRVRELCAAFGCEAVFGGDPRGATIKVKVPDGYTDDWGREGICVPTA